MFKKWIAVALLACLLTLPTGCDAKKTLENAQTAAQAQGREYGQTYQLKQDEAMETAFFKMTVNSVTKAATFEEYLPSAEGYQFLIVNMTVQNTFSDSIPMFDSDFEIKWDGLDEEETYFPESPFAEDQLPSEYKLAKDESRTGNLIFEVPADATEFDIKYYDLYEDEFEGNTFWMHLTAPAAA